MTQEIRIGDVEIISMLMPSSPRTVKTLAATPGCGLHAGADDGDLAHRLVAADGPDAELVDERLERGLRLRAGRPAAP